MVIQTQILYTANPDLGQLLLQYDTTAFVLCMLNTCIEIRVPHIVGR